MKEEIRQDGRTILSSEKWGSYLVQSNSIATGRKSGQAHFPNFETQSGRICRQHIRLFFEAPYHFYIPPLPDFPFLPTERFPFVPSHVPIHFLLRITYGTPHQH